MARATRFRKSARRPQGWVLSKMRQWGPGSADAARSCWPRPYSAASAAHPSRMRTNSARHAKRSTRRLAARQEPDPIKRRCAVQMVYRRSVFDACPHSLRRSGGRRSRSTSLSCCRRRSTMTPRLRPKPCWLSGCASRRVAASRPTRLSPSAGMVYSQWNPRAADGSSHQVRPRGRGRQP